MAGQYSDVTVYVVLSVCYAIAAISTGLRLYVRRFVTLRPLHLDDYLIIASILTLTVSIALSLYAVSNNLLHMQLATLPQLRQDLQITFVSAILYISDIWLVKFSILAFFSSVFSSIKLFIRLTAVYLAVSMGGCYLAELLFCHPISSFWDPLRVATDCHNANGIAITHCVMAVTSDVLVMAIPLMTLPQLRIGLKKKLSLYLVFAAGSFAIVAAIVRAAVSIRDLHFPAVVTLVANAPCLRVLIFPGKNFASGSASGQRSTAGYTRDRSTHDGFEMNNRTGVMTVVSSPSMRRNDQSGIRKNSLVMTKTVEVRMENEHVGKGVEEDSSSYESAKWAS